MFLGFPVWLIPWPSFKSLVHYMVLTTVCKPFNYILLYFSNKWNGFKNKNLFDLTVSVYGPTCTMAIDQRSWRCVNKDTVPLHSKNKTICHIFCQAHHNTCMLLIMQKTCPQSYAQYVTQPFLYLISKTSRSFCNCPIGFLFPWHNCLSSLYNTFTKVIPKCSGMNYAV